MFLEKIQKLPERTKKIILWTTVIIIGLFLFTWWVKNLEERIKTFQKETLLEQFGGTEIKEQFEEKIEELKDTPIIEQGKELMDLGETLLKGEEKDIKEMIKKFEKE